MPPTDPQYLRISCRTPLLGRYLRASSLKRVEQAARGGDAGAIRTLCLILSQSPDADLKDAARSALSSLSDPSAVEAFCDCMMESADPGLLSIAGACSYLPACNEKRALFYFLSGQTRVWQELDPLEGHPLLVRAILSATPGVRSRVFEKAREMGMASIFRALDLHADEVAWSPQEWRSRFLLYIRDGQWDALFRLIFLSPLPVAVEAVHALASSGWRPGREDLALWRELLASVPDRWEYPDPPHSHDGVLAGPGGIVAHAAISPDGHYLAASSDDGTLCQWSLPGGEILTSGKPGGGEGTVLAFSPDGTALVTGDTRGTIRVVAPASGTCIRVLEAHRGPVTALVFSREGDLLLSGGADGTVCSRDWPGCEGISCLYSHASEVTSLALHGEKVASGGKDGSIRLLDRRRGICRDLAGGGTAIRHLIFSPGGTHLAGVDRKGSIRMWDCTDGSLSRVLPPRGTRLIAWDATPDGRFGVLASRDHEAIVYSFPGGEESFSVEVPGKGISCLAIDPAGTRLLAGCRDGYLHAWPIPGKRKESMVKGHPDWIRLLAINQSGTGVVSAGRDGSVRLRALPGEALLATMQGPGNCIHCLATTPDGGVIACGTDGGILRAWKTQTREEVHSLNLFTRRAVCLALHPSGTMAACGDPQGRISLWDLSRRSLCGTLEGHEGGVHALAMSRDGSLLASGGWDGTIRLWSVPRGEPVATLPGHASPVTSLAFTPDGEFIASGSHDRSAMLWDLGAMDVHARLAGHAHVVSCLGFSGDGGILATGSWDSTIRLWHAPSGKPGGVLTGHSGRIQNLAVHPDGSLLVSAAEGGIIGLWSLPGGDLIRTREDRADACNGIAIIPSGNMVATAGLDGTLKLSGLPWTRPLSRTYPGDVEYIQSCIIPDLPHSAAVQWKFLERLLAGKFRHMVGYGGTGAPAGPYDIEIVENNSPVSEPFQERRSYAF